MARRRRRPLTATRLIGLALMTIAVLITVSPLLWMVKTAFTFNSDLFTDPGALLPPDPTWLNFKRALGMATPEETELTGGVASFDFPRILGNTVLYTVITVGGQVAFCTAAGYAFARLRFRGREAVFMLFLSGLFIPAILVSIPNFVLITDLGWINTYIGLIAPSFLMTPFGVFLMRQFFLGYPIQLEEAARLDGLGVLGTFFRVVIPTSIPPMLTLALISGVNQWQDYLWPLLVMRAPESRTLTVALAAFSDQSAGSQIDWSGMMAASTLSIIPIVIVLALTGKQIVGSIQLTGLK